MRYAVKIHEVHTVVINVDAENENDAKNKATELLMTEEFDALYNYTMEPEHWGVVERP